MNFTSTASTLPEYGTVSLRAQACARELSETRQCDGLHRNRNARNVAVHLRRSAYDSEYLGYSAFSDGSSSADSDTYCRYLQDKEKTMRYAAIYISSGLVRRMIGKNDDNQIRPFTQIKDSNRFNLSCQRISHYFYPYLQLCRHSNQESLVKLTSNQYTSYGTSE